MKEKTYISILDGFLRAKIYLMAITVILEINEIELQLFLLMLGIILTGISILCSMCINRKNWCYSWMISFVGCFFLPYRLYSNWLFRNDCFSGKNIKY